MTTRVSVIIPTTAIKQRESDIQRAIRSVLGQQGVDAKPVLVVNGSRFDPHVVDALKQDARLDVLQIAVGNVSRARHAGVVHSVDPYFCFLDDDDELLPGSIAGRLACFRDDVDLVVSNGRFLGANGVETQIVPREVTARIESDPLASLMDYNWLSAAAILLRADTVAASLFDFDLRYYECTWLALTLIDQGKTIRFCDMDGFLMHQGTPGSVTKTKDYVRARPAFIRRLRQFRLGDDFETIRRRRLANAFNELSRYERTWGHYGRSWAAHLQCLLSGGLRFLPYTRHLLRPQRLGDRAA